MRRDVGDVDLHEADAELSGSGLAALGIAGTEDEGRGMGTVWVIGVVLHRECHAVGLSFLPSSSSDGGSTIQFMVKETSLAATLRVWRERLTPAQAGLPDRTSRQTTGLRREELAELAGLSVDYLVRLEQGRSTAPSGPAVASLATALRLTQAERDHLYGLAGLRPPADQLISDEISPAVLRLLTRLGDIPVSVFAADWRQIWWSQSWAALVGDPSSGAPEDRNFVGACFPVPGGRSRVSGWPVLGDHPGKAKRARVADLRLASAQYPNDSRLMDLLHRLIGGNPEFAEMWRAGVVGNHSQDQMVVQHPVVGDVRVDCDVLTVGDTNLKIVTMTAEADSEDARRIERTRQALLSVMG